MRLLTAMEFQSPDAKAAFDRAQWLYDASERAAKDGLPDTSKWLSEVALAWFRCSRDMESKARNMGRIAAALMRGQ